MILGIDPGLGGALAFYEPALDMFSVIDMPTHTITVNKSLKRRIDLHQLASLIRANACADDHAIIEEVSASPQMGVTSAFSFGWSACAPVAILAALSIPYKLVRPNDWKRAMGLNADKDRSRQRASQLMPAHAHYWPNKGHDGRAEAALLAYYGSKLK